MKIGIYICKFKEVFNYIMKNLWIVLFGYFDVFFKWNLIVWF